MTPQSLPPHIAALPTPRSDAASNKSLFSGPALEHSRQLERELLWAMEVIHKMKNELFIKPDINLMLSGCCRDNDHKNCLGEKRNGWCQCPCHTSVAFNAYTSFKQYMEERR